MRRSRLLKATAAATAALSVLLALSLGLYACGSGGSASGDTASTMARAQAVDSSDLAPSFSGTTLNGKQVSLEQYRGKPLILVYMTYT